MQLPPRTRIGVLQRPMSILRKRVNMIKKQRISLFEETLNAKITSPLILYHRAPTQRVCNRLLVYSKCTGFMHLSK